MSPERLPLRRRSITSVSPLDWKEISAVRSSNVALVGSVKTSSTPTLEPLRNFNEVDPASILRLPI